MDTRRSGGTSVLQFRGCLGQRQHITEQQEAHHGIKIGSAEPMLRSAEAGDEIFPYAIRVHATG